MTSQFEIKWSNFESKFSGREREEAFEQLAYHLFCREFGLNKGLFRYKNQAGIETEPAIVDNEVIGFQAKYYDASINLSGKKGDLIDAIDKAKENNPALTKILFYINKEFGESSEKGKKEPDYKIEIEKKGTDCGVKVEWRVKSHLEIQLAQQNNKYVAEYYFGGDRSVWNYIENIESHTKNLLSSVNTHINYEGNKIYFEHDNCVKKYSDLIDNSEKCIIIAGEGGVGKTSFIKRWSEKDSPLLFVWKLSEFNVSSLQSVFSNYGNYNVYDLMKAFETDTRCKYVLLDSAEAIYEFSDRSTIVEFIKILYKYKWTIIFTIRTAYTENLKYTLKDISNFEYKEINITPVDSKELKFKLKEFNIEIPNGNKIQELLSIPFYLNEYIHTYTSDSDNITTIVQFMNCLWKKKILGENYQKDRLHIRRGDIMYQLVHYKVENNTFYVRERNLEKRDEEALQLLIRDEVIAEDEKRRCFISHDIYEEWTWFNIIEELYEDYKKDSHNFFAKLPDAMVVRRCFRQWIQWNLEDERDEILEFVLESIEQEWISLNFKDEMLIAILDSKYSYNFFSIKADLCLKDGATFLERILYLLGMTRKIMIGNQLMLPKGYGWGAVISFIYQNYDKILKSGIDKEIIIDILYDWTSNWHEGTICKYAGLISYKMIQDETSSYNINDKLIEVVLGSSPELCDEIEIMFEKAKQGDGRYEKIFIKALTTFSGLVLVNSNPEKIIEIAKFFWFGKKTDRGYHQSHYWEHIYGINPSHEFDYNPPSAYQPPIYWLIKADEEKGLRFVLETINMLIDNYVNNIKENSEYTVNKIIINIDGQEKEQYMDSNLWVLYRGGGNAPNLLMCILQALEMYLLEFVKDNDSDVCFDKIKFIVLNSNSVCITSIAVSLIEAYPYKLYELAYYLLEIPEIIMLDRERLAYESNIIFSLNIGRMYKTPIAQICVSEREAAYKAEFRKKQFEVIILEYQVANVLSDEFKQKIWKLLDKMHSKYENVKDETEMIFQRYYIQMDFRRQNVQEYNEEGRQGYIIEPQFNEEQNKKIEELKKHVKLQNEKAELDSWLHARFEDNESKYIKYTKYEKNPCLAYKEMMNFNSFAKKNPELAFMVQRLKPYVCCVLLKDFESYLKRDMFDECVCIIHKEAEEMLNYPNQINVEGIGNDAVITAIVILAYRKQSEYDLELLLKLFLLKDKEFKKMIILNIKKYAKDIIDFIIVFMIKIQARYEKLISGIYYEPILDIFENFWSKNKEEIFELRSKTYDVDNIDLQKSSMQTISLLMELTIEDKIL